MNSFASDTGNQKVMCAMNLNAMVLIVVCMLATVVGLDVILNAFCSESEEVRTYTNGDMMRQEIVDANGNAHGVSRSYERGILIEETWFDHGTNLETKSYRVDGTLLRHVYQDWKFRTIWDEYDADGKLLNRRVLQ